MDKITKLRELKELLDNSIISNDEFQKMKAEVMGSKSNETIASAFPSITIGNQIWMAKNLDVLHFRNGEKIPIANNAEEWESAGDAEEPICAWHNFNSDNTEYGLYYNSFALTDARGIAPAGWKIPLEADWDNLFNFLGGADSGLKLKSNSGWKNSSEFNEKGARDGNGSNESGFNALPGGYCSIGGEFSDETGYFGYWWALSNNDNLFIYQLSWHENSINKFEGPDIQDGINIRCVKS